jgi:hypothetical protein
VITALKRRSPSSRPDAAIGPLAYPGALRTTCGVGEFRPHAPLVRLSCNCRRG